MQASAGEGSERWTIEGVCQASNLVLSTVFDLHLQQDPYSDAMLH